MIRNDQVLSPNGGESLKNLNKNKTKQNKKTPKSFVFLLPLYSAVFR